MGEEYPPPDDRWVKVGPSGYFLPTSERTQGEKERNRKRSKNIKIKAGDENRNMENKSAVIIQRYLRGHLCRKPMINIVNNHDLIDLDNLSILIKSEFVKDDTTYTNRGNMVKEEKSNLKMDSDLAEWLIKKCVKDGKRIGQGNGAIDIETDEIGIDVACTCLNGNFTNEKSLAQKLKDSGNLLDIHFEEKKDKLAVELYKKSFKEKFDDFKKDKYYLFLISTKKEIYICMLTIDINQLHLVQSCGFSTQGKSIKTRGFINSKYGSVILYKSKKRIELRLNKEILKYSHKLFTLS